MPKTAKKVVSKPKKSAAKKKEPKLKKAKATKVVAKKVKEKREKPAPGYVPREEQRRAARDSTRRLISEHDGRTAPVTSPRPQPEDGVSK